MEKAYDYMASTFTPNLETAHPATRLFAIGTPTKTLTSKYPHSLISRTISARSTSSRGSKPTGSGKPNNRPITYGTVRPKPKFENKPVAQSVPLAFPASTNFVFDASNLDTKITTSDRKNVARAIQILPTDVLILVIRSIEPNRHHQILKNLSLVSRLLNVAIAPILYHNLRLFDLKEVYDFALHFRHPTCVTSLEIFLTPDPQDPKWSPPNTNWTERLVETLKKMEMLMSLSIKRCSSTSVLDSIVRQSNDPSFLPALQRLSFGYWHQLTCLTVGRALTSYGLAFDIQGPSDYENLDRALIGLNLSSKSVIELKLTVTFTDSFQAHVDSTGDCGGKIIHSIARYFPHLRKLVLRTQSRKGSINKHHKLVDILTQIPQQMPHLSHLELSDPRSPQYQFEAIIKIAKQLSEGLYPKLRFLSLDGLLWKRAPDSSTPHSESLELSHLSLNEHSGNTHTRNSPIEDKPEAILPKLDWTPCPSNPRGLTWWANKASRFRASSRNQPVFLLREWMLEYWDPIYVPTSDSMLDRAARSS